MKCPECGKEIKNREFYDHMCEMHFWSLEAAEIFADNWYVDRYDFPMEVIRFPQSMNKEKIDSKELRSLHRKVNESGT